MLNNNLDDIYLNFHPMDCKILSLISNVMSYFKYDVSEEWYYVMGYGTQLGFPFLINEVEYFKACFNLIGKICYFTGAWNTDYLTQDKEGFLKALQYKWLEWEHLKQNMPFIVGRMLQGDGKTEFYILINYDVNLGNLIVINEKGERSCFTKDSLISNIAWIGFSAIDVPNNFLVNSKLYRDPYKAGENCFKKILVNFQNMDYMVGTLQKMAYCMEQSIVENLFLKINEHCKKQDLNPNFNRQGFSYFLQKKGYQKLADQYYLLGNDWNNVFAKYNSLQKMDIGFISSIAIRELKCINQLQLCELTVR